MVYLDAGDRFELPMRLAYETGVVTTLPAINWSEYKDSNLGPSGPKPDALPGCATLRLSLCSKLGTHILT